jgi:hypothetical protein
MLRLIPALLLTLALPATAAAQTSGTIRTGTGFAVSADTLIITNAHVVKSCRTLRVLQQGAAAQARLVAADDQTDLAVLRTQLRTSKLAALRAQPPVRLGEQVVSFGFPLAGSLSKEGNLTTGNVSALAGLRDDATYLQITAPVQPGNSGGPLMDEGGNIIGVVTSKLDALKLAQRIGDIPQNVNFAIKADVLRRFLDARKLTYKQGISDAPLAVADIADLAKAFTVQVECSPASTTAQVQRLEQPSPEGVPPAPAPAPTLPPPSAALPDWVKAVTVVDAKTPFPASAPNTRQLTVSNATDRRLYELTVAWLNTESAQPCNVARDRFAGQRTIFAAVAPGGTATVYGEFPPAARSFCIVDAKAMAAAPKRGLPAPTAEPPPAPEAPQEKRD